MDGIERSNPLWLAWQLVRHFGCGWLVGRFVYILKRRSGWLARRMPSADWHERPLEQLLADPRLAQPEAYLSYRLDEGPRFFFDGEDRAEYAPLLAFWDERDGGPIAESDDVRRGEFRYFHHETAKLGMPPDWHLNPFTGGRYATHQHWSRIPDFAGGDIKVVWEPGRFAFTYALVRAYWRTGEEAYAETFWQLVESWRKANPPNQGPHWMCGQEAALRTMAWCFGLYGFSRSSASRPQRVADLAQMMAVTGERIEANLGYALSQHNNHGVSEGLGLWTIGLLFPELRAARRWRDKGRRVLESLVRELIYEDGSCSQHSLNYQRLMLHNFIWAQRLGQLNNDPLCEELTRRVGQSADMLYQVQDERSGGVPCYGHNDGALVLPLSNGAYHDYRPVIQAAHLLATGSRRYESGPWDEALLWLFGQRYAKSPVEPSRRDDLSADAGGYYTLRSAHGCAFTRCGTFRHRPGQADMLHVDLTWQGHEIAIDPGTYGYNAPPPWNGPLAETAQHNTITVDGRGQMRRAGRFVWLPWLRGRHLARQRSPSGLLAYWQGQHDGYMRLKSPAPYCRGILRLGDDHWLVLDRLQSRAAHVYRLHWLLADLPCDWEREQCRLTLHTPSGDYRLHVGADGPFDEATLCRADAGSPRGWRARYYSSREPALSLALEAEADDRLFWTLFGPDAGTISLDGDHLLVENDRWSASVRLGGAGGDPIVASVSITGALEDSMTVHA